MLIRDKDRQSLQAIFASVQTPFEVWAYGSRVTGTAHDTSDIDLVLRTPDLSPLPMEVLVTLKEKLQDSNIPVMVDLFDWARLPSAFHANILNTYEVLFPNPHAL